jgi:hypothetical protein
VSLQVACSIPLLKLALLAGVRVFVLEGAEDVKAFVDTEKARLKDITGLPFLTPIHART